MKPQESNHNPDGASKPSQVVGILSVERDCEKEDDDAHHGSSTSASPRNDGAFTEDEDVQMQEQDAGTLNREIEEEGSVSYLAFGAFKAEPRPEVVKKIEEEPSLAGSDTLNNSASCANIGSHIRGDNDATSEPYPGPCLEFGKFKAEPRPEPPSVKKEEVPSVDVDSGASYAGVPIKEGSPSPWLGFGKFKAEPRSDPSAKKAEEETTLAGLDPPDPNNAMEHMNAGPDICHDEADAGANMPAPQDVIQIPSDEDAPNELTEVDRGTVEPRPKRRRLVIDAVVLPTLQEVLGRPITRPSESNDEIDEKLRKMQNPNVQKKEGLGFSLDTVRERLRPIGFDLYPVQLDRDLQGVLVSRKFLSMNYGGSMQMTFPAPGKNFRPVDGVFRNFLCLMPDYHSNAPEMPGAPGLYFNACTAGPSHPIPGTFTVFTRITSKPKALWQYQGEYQLGTSPSFTKEEWARESEHLRATWAEALSELPWGGMIRARVYLRRTLGREFTEEEFKEELAVDEEKTYVGTVTKDEIGQAFLQGKESLAVWTMKCVGYDAEFQGELAKRFPQWVPPPSKKKAGSKAKAGPKAKASTEAKAGSETKSSKPVQSGKKSVNQGSKDTKVGKKRKRADTDVESGGDEYPGDIVSYQDDDNDDNEEEGPRYRPRGTRSRPIELD